jgi:hypothetical protein
MRGQDDLVYTSYSDKRPDFANQGGKIQSSGKYTWFFTFLPTSNADKKVDVDVLACYNRVPDDDIQAKCELSASKGGGILTFSDVTYSHATYSERLEDTKCVFVTWETTEGTGESDGAWGKIVFLDKTSSKPQVVVVGRHLPETVSDVQVYIPSGVLYHKRVKNITMN